MTILETLEKFDVAGKKLINKDDISRYEIFYMNALARDTYSDDSCNPIVEFGRLLIMSGERAFFNELLKEGVIDRNDLGNVNLLI